MTQCCIAALKNQEGSEEALEVARSFERMYCKHNKTVMQPGECLKAIVQRRRNGVANCFIVATQNQELRNQFRDIAGVPLIYVNRGVMILEPMSKTTQSHIAKKQVNLQKLSTMERAMLKSQRKTTTTDEAREKKEAAIKANPTGSNNIKVRRGIRRGKDDPKKDDNNKDDN